MIFICVGSREYPFDRLIKKVDELIASGEISEPVIAQIGLSQYTPLHCTWYRFLDRDEFHKYQKEAEIIISHGGTGALIGALKLGKQVIAVPRFARYREHIDDHQIQISEVLAKEGYLREVLDIENLGETIRAAQEQPIRKRYGDRPSNILSIIENYLSDNL